MNKKTKITVTIDKIFDQKMEETSVNKSKLINNLLKKYINKK